jgi:hypothetical protein
MGTVHASFNSGGMGNVMSIRDPRTSNQCFSLAPQGSHFYQQQEATTSVHGNQRNEQMAPLPLSYPNGSFVHPGDMFQPPAAAHGSLQTGALQPPFRTPQLESLLHQPTGVRSGEDPQAQTPPTGRTRAATKPSGGGSKRAAPPTGEPKGSAAPKGKRTSRVKKTLEQQKEDRRERNRRHARCSRARKKVTE